MPAGHILGSTLVEVRAEGRTVVFSGDLGRDDPITLPPRLLLKEADALVIESTYGDRCHPKEPVAEILTRIINQTVSRGGHVLIPTFAIGRSQEILSHPGRTESIPSYSDRSDFLG